MTWSKEPPTRAGWYWFRDGANDRAQAMRVAYYSPRASYTGGCFASTYADGDDEVAVVEMGGEWYRPSITEPVDATLVAK